jgi:hypothetical protein
MGTGKKHLNRRKSGVYKRIDKAFSETKNRDVERHIRYSGLLSSHSFKDSTHKSLSLVVQVGFGGAGMYLVGVGLESGEIHVMSWLAASRQFQAVRVLDRELAHHATVTRLAFRYRT